MKYFWIHRNFWFFHLMWTHINQLVFRRMNRPYRAVRVRSTNFSHLVHTLIGIIRVLCWEWLQIRVTQDTANVRIRMAYLFESMKLMAIVYLLSIFHLKLYCSFDNIVYHLFYWKPGTFAISWWIDVSKNN